MPALSDYTAGTITLTNGSVNFTGSGTGWEAADFREGDTILGIEDNAGVEYVIATITGNGAGTLTQEWEGATGTYAYRMRYMADGARVTAQARNLIELLGNGNLQALAGLTGPGVPVFNGPHAMEIKPVTDFVNGVAYDVQVDTLADRAAYDGQSEGFAVLVSDMGDGRSALFSKASNTSGDWTDPAYVTGPSVSVTVGTTTEGPFGSSPDVTGVTGAGSLQLNFELPGSPSIDATVSSSPPGTTAGVVTTPVAGGYELDFTLPEASGFYNAGVYDIAEAYSQDEVVRHNGSSFIALQAVPAGTSPSSAFPPTDTAYWQVLAAKGADGSGTGDVVGPSGAVADSIAVFDGTTGKLIKDGGVGISGLQPVLSGTASVELGSSLSGNRVSYIDFHSSDGVDFSARLTRASGINGGLSLTQTGTGPIDIDGGSDLTRDGHTVFHAGNSDFQPNLGWKPVQVIKLSGFVAALVLTVPAGSNHLRITGSFNTENPSAVVFARVSIDGGGTYLSGAADYFTNALWLLNGGVPSINSGSAAAHMMVAVEQGDVALRSNVDIQFDFGSSRWLSTITKQSAYDTQNRFASLRSWVAADAMPTHIQLFPSTNFFAPGTSLLVEAF